MEYLNFPCLMVFSEKYSSTPLETASPTSPHFVTGRHYRSECILRTFLFVLLEPICGKAAACRELLKGRDEA